jgi:hypothetical protein
MRLIKSGQVAELFNTAHPTLAIAEELRHRIAGRIDRAESVAFEAYNDAQEPTHWVFVGYTAD